MSLAEARRMAFEAALDMRDFTYEEIEGQSARGLKIGFALYNVRNIQICFWFQADGESAHVTTNSIAWVPEDRRERALEAVNEANLRWRWVSLFMQDGDIVAAADVLLMEDVVGELCMDFLLHRFLAVINDVFPFLMARVWAEDPDVADS